jgi:hypothetical protein
MNGNERYALLMELANVMIDMGHSVRNASVDDNGVCLETEKDDVEVRFWVSVKKKSE